MAAKRRKNRFRKTPPRASTQRTTGGLETKNYILIIGAVILALAAVSAIVIFDQGGRGASHSRAQMGDVSLDKSKGADDAPVVVVEYGDFQ